MKQARPDTQTILAGLKDFQRDTVEYVFRRLYLDDNCVRRFLVADEVGLGKTLVARGVIAKTIDFLWDRVDRLDIIYVCSNSDIARQNIRRLNATGCKDFSLSSRITLLPITVGDMQHRRINFISFTPGTSFNLKSSGGIARERALIYSMLKDAWSLKSSRASRPFEVTAGRKRFQREVAYVQQQCRIHETLSAEFVECVLRRPELRQQFDDLLAQTPPRKKIPDELRRQSLGWIGELRRLLAETCLRWLEPDLIILDEFQRFKHLLQGDADDASEAAQLAEHLFNFQDSTTAARVLLLSATPYKMYTQHHESHEDDHYADFQTTLDFLLPDPVRREQFHSQLRQYRDELFRLADHGVDELVKTKCELESLLRDVMVRTERLALKADRNGMLVDVPSEQVALKPTDLQHYLGLQKVANQLGHNDVLEYWKSAPYLLNFMDDYDFKRKLREACASAPDVQLARAVRSIGSGLLNREEIERYRRLDPANARLRSLHQDTIGREAWRLLWVPPSLPYYEGSGPFADPKLAGFTKRLVFSCWRVVPKAIASVLSYEAERSMMQRFRRKAQNTAEARHRRSALLRFGFSKKRPTGMPVLGMLYPCRTLADHFDPLALKRELDAVGTPATQGAVLSNVTSRVADLLAPVVHRYADPGEQEDERWYWAAPLLLDVEQNFNGIRKWFEQENIASVWSGEALSGDHEAARGWAQHVEIAEETINGKVALGQPPGDLPRVMALLATAGPGVVSLRALKRILPTECGPDAVDIRSFAGPLAHSFLHLFNLPEVTCLLRDQRKEVPYWRSVLEYAVAGNLQAVMDELAHVLLESLGLIGSDRTQIAKEVCKAISGCLTLRTSTAQADIVTFGTRRVRLNESIRLRTRFAMRFGDQETEDSAEPTRADQVRQAFNSPFWPFVLATTSVGQEGLDFHPYCHAVVHWNLPSNPVDLEQREGRVHRYKGHALRKNIGASMGLAMADGSVDPWQAMFDAARQSRPEDENDLFPFWITPEGDARIERHVPALPLSRETTHQVNLRRSLVLYRLVFGQNRQEDLVEYLLSRLSQPEVERIVELCRIDLSAPRSAYRS